MKKAIPFGFMLASGLIVVAVPGNYGEETVKLTEKKE